MIAAWIAVACLWGAALALIGANWYFRKTIVTMMKRIVDLSQRVARLEAHGSTIVIASSEREVLDRIAAILSDDDDEPTRTH